MDNHRFWRALNLAITGSMVGNEFGIWIAVHPALARLPPRQQARPEQELIRRYFWIMPLWTGAALASYVPVLRGVDRGAGWPVRATLGSLGCLLAMVGVTLVGNLPLNLRILALDAEHPPPDWPEVRRRWDRWHVLRILLLWIAFALLCSAAVRERRA